MKPTIIILAICVAIFGFGMWTGWFSHSPDTIVVTEVKEVEVKEFVVQPQLSRLEVND